MRKTAIHDWTSWASDMSLLKAPLRPRLVPLPKFETIFSLASQQGCQNNRLMVQFSSTRISLNLASRDTQIEVLNNPDTLFRISLDPTGQRCRSAYSVENVGRLLGLNDAKVKASQ